MITKKVENELKLNVKFMKSIFYGLPSWLV